MQYFLIQILIIYSILNKIALGASINSNLLINSSTCFTNDEIENGFNENDSVLYIPSTGLNLIISAPHGGSRKPNNILDRVAGCYNERKKRCMWKLDCMPKDYKRCRSTNVGDTNTLLLSRHVRRHLCRLFKEKCPALIANLLDRSKLDANRGLEEATFIQDGSVKAYELYHRYIVEEKQKFKESLKHISTSTQAGLFIDLHGQSHIPERTEIGYLIPGKQLRSHPSVNQEALRHNSLKGLVKFLSLNQNSLKFKNRGDFFGKNPTTFIVPEKLNKTNFINNTLHSNIKEIFNISLQENYKSSKINQSLFYFLNTLKENYINRESEILGDLLWGPLSLSVSMAKYGLPSIPSQEHPYPLDNEFYFNGGYNTLQYGSLNVTTVENLLKGLIFEFSRSHFGERDYKDFLDFGNVSLFSLMNSFEGSFNEFFNFYIQRTVNINKNIVIQNYDRNNSIAGTANNDSNNYSHKFHSNEVDSLEYHNETYNDENNMSNFNNNDFNITKTNNNENETNTNIDNVTKNKYNNNSSIYNNNNNINNNYKAYYNTNNITTHNYNESHVIFNAANTNIIPPPNTSRNNNINNYKSSESQENNNKNNNNEPTIFWTPSIDALQLETPRNPRNSENLPLFACRLALSIKDFFCKHYRPTVVMENNDKSKISKKESIKTINNNDRPFENIDSIPTVTTVRELSEAVTIKSKKRSIANNDYIETVDNGYDYEVTAQLKNEDPSVIVINQSTTTVMQTNNERSVFSSNFTVVATNNSKTVTIIRMINKESSANQTVQLENYTTNNLLNNNRSENDSTINNTNVKNNNNLNGFSYTNTDLDMKGNYLDERNDLANIHPCDEIDEYYDCNIVSCLV